MQSYLISDQCFSGFEGSSINLNLQPIYKQHILTATKVHCLRVCVCLYIQYTHCARETISELIGQKIAKTNPGSENENYVFCQVEIRE